MRKEIYAITSKLDRFIPKPAMLTNRRRAILLAAAVALAAALLLMHRPTVHAQGEPGQLTVYSPQTTYAIPIVNANGQSYIGLVELLEPLGSVETKVDGKKYKLQFLLSGGRKQEMQFTEGKEKGKSRGQNVKLPANFVLQNGRGYVPLTDISGLIAPLLSQSVELRQAAGRLFIGDVAKRFSFDLRPGTPSRLFISFNSPVNATIATEPGRVRLNFGREPVVWYGNDKTTYTDSLITGANFSEHNGVAELDVTGTAPMMANYADGGKTIIITAAPPPPPVAQAPAPAPQPAAPAQQAAAPQPKAPVHPRFLVLIDPGHGGDDIGAAITPKLAEKDVVLALGRRVVRELSNRGIAAALLRNGDYAISLDQRAATANADRPALYVTLHAANTGKGVRVYTALLPAANLAPGTFLPWDTAQSAFTDLSGTVAGSVAAELEARKLPNTTLPAPLRPMNNVAAPAIAVEIAPPGSDVNEIAAPVYQEQVAQSIAAGILAVRPKLPEVRP